MHAHRRAPGRSFGSRKVVAIIDRTVGMWTNECLLRDRSLVLDDHFDTWSGENVDELHGRFNENQLEGDVAGGNFLSKWDVLRLTSYRGLRRLSSTRPGGLAHNAVT
jgi:hypothetical protein